MVVVKFDTILKSRRIATKQDTALFGRYATGLYRSLLVLGVPAQNVDLEDNPVLFGGMRIG